MKKFIPVIILLAMIASPAAAKHGGPHINVTVNGLVCDFCAVSMKKTFGKKAGVEAVDVNLTTKIVRIDMKKDAKLEDADIKKGITDAGYDVVKIERD